MITVSGVSTSRASPASTRSAMRLTTCRAPRRSAGATCSRGSTPTWASRVREEATRVSPLATKSSVPWGSSDHPSRRSPAASAWPGATTTASAWNASTVASTRSARPSASGTHRATTDSREPEEPSSATTRSRSGPSPTTTVRRRRPREVSWPRSRSVAQTRAKQAVTTTPTKATSLPGSGWRSSTTAATTVAAVSFSPARPTRRASATPTSHGVAAAGRARATRVAHSRASRRPVVTSTGAAAGSGTRTRAAARQARRSTPAATGAEAARAGTETRVRPRIRVGGTAWSSRADDGVAGSSSGRIAVIAAPSRPSGCRVGRRGSSGPRPPPPGRALVVRSVNGKKRAARVHAAFG